MCFRSSSVYWLFASSAGRGSITMKKKYAPNKTQASLKDYFGVEGDQVAIYVNDEKAKENGTEVTAQCVNGGVFLPV